MKYFYYQDKDGKTPAQEFLNSISKDSKGQFLKLFDHLKDKQGRIE
jgi:hypothetical protein